MRSQFKWLIGAHPRNYFTPQLRNPDRSGICLLPAAFQAVEVAARFDTARLDPAQRRGGRVLYATVGVGHAAACEHGLDIVIRDGVAGHQDIETRFADAGHR